MYCDEPMRPRRIRTRLLLAVVGAVAAALALTVLGFSLFLGRSLGSSASQLARSRATAELSVLRSGPHGLQLGEAPDTAAPDTPIWVFAGTYALEAPRAGSILNAAAASLAGGPARFLDVREPHTRLYAQPAVINGRRAGTVVAAVALGPYDQTGHTALVGAIGLAILALVVVALAASWLLAAALRPVSQMTRHAAIWSETGVPDRFGRGEPQDEITELASTLDILLDRLAASLRREQRFSAELSHELRHPLSRLLAETELALRRDRAPADYRNTLARIHRDALQLARTLDALLAAARQEAGIGRGTADAYTVAVETVHACAPLAAERRLDLKAEPPPAPLRIGVESRLAERILQPLVENACRYGRARIRVKVSRNATCILYVVEDDGPGIQNDERETIFEPGTRGSANHDHQTGAGLGLALARRLARSAAGDVTAEPSDSAGRFLVKLPPA
jgi:signal transduction histidine kinase